MYAHFLIATDGSELSDKAVGHGLALAKVLRAKVTAVHVTERWRCGRRWRMGYCFRGRGI